MAYIFFWKSSGGIGVVVSHVVILNKKDDAWADGFCREHGFDSWQSCDTFDIDDNSEGLQRKYAK